jgi:hypothetical protein
MKGDEKIQRIKDNLFDTDAGSLTLDQLDF